MTKNELLMKAIDEVLGDTIAASAKIQANYENHGLIVQRPATKYTKKKG